MHVYIIVLPYKVSVKKGNGHTWLFLINGGEKSFEEEKVARDELKRIYRCLVSNQLVKPEHVVCASGGKEKLFQHETVTNVSKVSFVVPQKPPPKPGNMTVQSTTISLNMPLTMAVRNVKIVTMYVCF